MLLCHHCRSLAKRSLQQHLALMQVYSQLVLSSTQAQLARAAVCWATKALQASHKVPYACWGCCRQQLQIQPDVPGSQRQQQPQQQQQQQQHPSCLLQLLPEAAGQLVAEGDQTLLAALLLLLLLLLLLALQCLPALCMLKKVAFLGYCGLSQQQQSGSCLAPAQQQNSCCLLHLLLRLLLFLLV
jgi:hypothetical protein